MLEQNIDLAEIAVNPDVLKWARNERGLDRGAAARLLQISELELAALEDGHKKPRVTLLHKIADKYQINYVSLFLPSPPPALPKLHDFRTHTGVGAALTSETAVAIQDVRDALETFAEMRAENERTVPLPRLEMLRPKESPDELAARMRRRFAVSIEDQQGWSLSFARDEWRRRIEALGVFVYLKPMNLDDCRGFSMLHEGLAAICVNDREENAGAESFTLWHEFCHLLRRQTGISDENRYNRVERYCNLFAASFLIPKTKLRDILKSPTKPIDYSDKKVKQLATIFKVSNRAMALRLEYTGLAPQGFYSKRTAAWDVPKPRVFLLNREMKGPSAVSKAARRFGRHHTSTVLRGYESGLLSGSDAHAMLEVPIPSFKRLGLVVG